MSFVDWLLEQEQGQFFVRIDDEFLAERARSPEIKKHVKHPEEMLSILLSSKTSLRGSREADAIHMYGLIHKKYIETPAGMQKMLEKRATGDFPKCRRHFCHGCVCVPVGLSDQQNSDGVKMFCPNCTDFYEYPSKTVIRGIYFGKEWVHRLMAAHSEICDGDEAEQFVPKIFGFNVSLQKMVPRPI